MAANLVPQSPLMGAIDYQGQQYFTSQFFHRQYVTNSQQAGKYVRHPDFLRVLRSIDAYSDYVAQGDIVELDWSRMKAEGKQDLLSFQPLFQAAGWNPLTLLNSTAQLALHERLDDELSRQISVAKNTSAARQMSARNPGELLPLEKAEREALAGFRISKLFGIPEHIAQQEVVKLVEQTTGVNLRPLMLTSPAQSDIKADEEMLEPNDLAKRLGLPSGHYVNQALEHVGWQVKQIQGTWQPTPAGLHYAARHAWVNHGKSGYNWKWNCAAVEQILNAHTILPYQAQGT